MVTCQGKMVAEQSAVFPTHTARRLERNIKDALEEMGEDRSKLEQLLTGKRVDLAEELSK